MAEVKGGALTVLGLDLLRSGYTVRFTATGRSMDPTIREGEIIHVAPVAPAAVQVGEVVLFSTGRGITAHRVMEIVQPPGEAERLFLTQGDLFSAWFEPVLAKQLLGRITAVERAGRALPLTGSFNVRWQSMKVRAVRARRKSLPRLLRGVLFSTAIALCSVSTHTGAAAPSPSSPPSTSSPLSSPLAGPSIPAALPRPLHPDSAAATKPRRVRAARSAAQPAPPPRD